MYALKITTNGKYPIDLELVILQYMQKLLTRDKHGRHLGLSVVVARQGPGEVCALSDRAGTSSDWGPIDRSR